VRRFLSVQLFLPRLARRFGSAGQLALDGQPCRGKSDQQGTTVHLILPSARRIERVSGMSPMTLVEISGVGASSSLRRHTGISALALTSRTRPFSLKVAASFWAASPSSVRAASPPHPCAARRGQNNPLRVGQLSGHDHRATLRTIAVHQPPPDGPHRRETLETHNGQTVWQASCTSSI